jgi:hypothetical protein
MESGALRSRKLRSGAWTPDSEGLELATGKKQAAQGEALSGLVGEVLRGGG